MQKNAAQQHLLTPRPLRQKNFTLPNPFTIATAIRTNATRRAKPLWVASSAAADRPRAYAIRSLRHVSR